MEDFRCIPTGPLQKIEDIYSPVSKNICSTKILSKKYFLHTLRRFTETEIFKQVIFPAGIYLLKVNNKNTRTRCEICSKLSIKTSERWQWDFSYLILEETHFQVVPCQEVNLGTTSFSSKRRLKCITQFPIS